MAAKLEKPKIGKKVYCIVDEWIVKYVVGYLGKDSFIIEDYWNVSIDNFGYEDFGETWFYTIKDAKEKMLANEGDEYKIVKIYDDEWRIVKKTRK